MPSPTYSGLATVSILGRQLRARCASWTWSGPAKSLVIDQSQHSFPLFCHVPPLPLTACLCRSCCSRYPGGAWQGMGVLGIDRVIGTVSSPSSSPLLVGLPQATITISRDQSDGRLCHNSSIGVCVVSRIGAVRFTSIMDGGEWIMGADSVLDALLNAPIVGDSISRGVLSCRRWSLGMKTRLRKDHISLCPNKIGSGSGGHRGKCPYPSRNSSRLESGDTPRSHENG